MKKILITIVAIAMIIGGIKLFTPINASANPSSYNRMQMADATTTKAYLAASTATATTTLSFDTSIGTGSGTMDSAVLLLQFTATSTINAPILVTRFEYSQDGTDWYPQMASSTNQAILLENTWTVSTSTNTFLNGGTSQYTSGAATTTKMMQSYSVLTPTRWVRAVIYIPTSGGKGAVWAEFVGKRQNY